MARKATTGETGKARTSHGRVTARPDSEWSAAVTRTSHALEEGVFTWKDPRRIACSLQRSAETSTRRKTSAFRSAMSIALVKYLDQEQLKILEQAKQELRNLYGKK